VLAIPAFRFVLKRVRVQPLDDELEKDLEQWFKCSLMLLVASRFMEPHLFGWLIGDAANIFQGETIDPILGGLRILLAIGVIELMPDQDLFSIVHPGPKFQYDRSRAFWPQVRENIKPLVRGLVCQHLNRSSPVFAILAAIVRSDTASAVCYLLAITQYLIIGLVTSRDRALDVLSEFDRQVANRRRQVLEGLSRSQADGPACPTAGDSTAGCGIESRLADDKLEGSEDRSKSVAGNATPAGIVAKADPGEYESD
jgi:hypothetical protein